MLQNIDEMLKWVSVLIAMKLRYGLNMLQAYRNGTCVEQALIPFRCVQDPCENGLPGFINLTLSLILVRCFISSGAHVFTIYDLEYNKPRRTPQARLCVAGHKKAYCVEGSFLCRSPAA